MIKQKKTPQRLCSGCQALQDKKAMTRVVRKPDGEVALDPGRERRPVAVVMYAEMLNASSGRCRAKASREL